MWIAKYLKVKGIVSALKHETFFNNTSHLLTILGAKRVIYLMDALFFSKEDRTSFCSILRRCLIRARNIFATLSQDRWLERNKRKHLIIGYMNYCYYCCNSLGHSCNSFLSFASVAFISRWPNTITVMWTIKYKCMWLCYLIKITGKFLVQQRSTLKALIVNMKLMIQ